MTPDEYAELYRLLGLAIDASQRHAEGVEAEWYILMAARTIASRRELALRFPEPEPEPETVTT